MAAPRAAVHEVRRASSAVTVDGALDEAAWSDAAEIPVAYEWFPGDNVQPPVETRAYVTFDEATC